MITISIDEIQRDLLGYLHRVQAGETVVVLQGGKPVAEIKPVTPKAGAGDIRPFGLSEGEFVVPDDFDEPLPEEILNQFEEK
jgi:antitoxin (DNA-binding transcriptional repressor) of toxin-antitoxin stability system